MPYMNPCLRQAALQPQAVPLDVLRSIVHRLGCFDMQPRRSKRAQSKAVTGEVVAVSSTSSTESLGARRAQEKEFVQKHDSETSEVSGKGGLPGPITNETLVRPDGSPLPGKRAVEHLGHFRGVNPEVWQYLQSRHGGGPEIVRMKQIKLYVDSPTSRPNAWSNAPPISSAFAMAKSAFTASPGSTTMSPAKSKSVSTPVASQGKVTCDKCDGPHATETCPHFEKPRDKHPDAWCLKGKSHLVAAAELEEAKFVSRARVVRQPGDGSCLFHSVSYGLGDGSTAHSLRKGVADTISGQPNMQILDTPLAEWIRMDANVGVNSYVQRLRGGAPEEEFRV
ncbi:USP20 [Symbiodinium natans]|uniref:USP20 protein n=1 Tax=Symbiodinium natans TaxID=878477 RepID=A0A812UTK8_9DINO|nr:USP20 [Symbiodinium natans]